MKDKQKKIKISITMDKKLLDMMDNRCSNRSQYMEYVLEFYFTSLKIDISKIKL